MHIYLFPFIFPCNHFIMYLFITTYTAGPSAPLPQKPTRKDSNSSSQPPLAPSTIPAPRKYSDISEMSDHGGGDPNGGGSSNRYPVPPSAPPGSPPPPPAVPIKDASELQARVTRLRQPPVPQPGPSRLPVQPPDIINQGRSNLKHTSAAQERRMQQQQLQQQQQQAPKFGRALLKQTSQFDRLVNAPASNQVSPKGISRKSSPPSAPSPIPTTEHPPPISPRIQNQSHHTKTPTATSATRPNGDAPPGPRTQTKPILDSDNVPLGRPGAGGGGKPGKEGTLIDKVNHLETISVLSVVFPVQVG